MTIQKTTITFVAVIAAFLFSFPQVAYALPKGQFLWECNKTITPKDSPPEINGTGGNFVTFVYFYVDGQKIDVVWTPFEESQDYSVRKFRPNNWNPVSYGKGLHKLTAEVMREDATKAWVTSNCGTDYLQFTIDDPQPTSVTVNEPVNAGISSKSCEEKSESVNKSLSRITERAESRLQHAESILQKVEAFYSRSNREVPIFEEFLEKAQNANDTAEKELLLLKQKRSVDCNLELKLQVLEYRDQLGKTKESIRTFKQAVKDTIGAFTSEKIQ